jgi:trigger factor
MNIIKKELEKSRFELLVTLTWDEFKIYLEKGAEAVSESVKVEGFRPGKVPYEVLKQKVGEMTILEETARVAINKTIDKAFDQELKGEQLVGQPNVDITKLAPDNDFEYKVIVSALPKLTLGAYKEIKVKLTKPEVKDEDLQRTLTQIQEMRAKEAIKEGGAKINDKVLVDIEMFLDKVPVEGGQTKGAAVLLGKDYFIPGFDKNIVGLKKDETKEFSLLYPANHHQNNLAGKLVNFKVKVIEVYSRELPELNDEFAKNMGFKNLVDMNTNISDGLLEEQKQKNEQKAEIEMLNQIVLKTKFGDIPDILVEHEVKTMMSELEQTILRQGARFEDYLASLKKTKEQLSLDLLPDAVKRVKNALIIREIAVAEKIEVSEKEIDDKLEELKKAYKGDEKINEMLKEPGYKRYIANVLNNQKVIAQLKEWNLEK